MTKRVKRQIATFLLVTQLAFSLFAPFAPLAHLIPQAFASDDIQTVVDSDTLLSFSVEETDSSNQLVVKSNLEDSVELPYALYYLHDHTIQALKGELVANSENVLFIGSQSNDDFLSHDWQKMVFKVQLGDEVRSYYLQKQTEGELVGRTFITDSLEISGDDTQWISWLTDAENKVATTIENVVEGQQYLYPFNDKVSVTFTKLPEESGTLTISQLELDEELAEKFGTDVAFDITTTMENGTFEFDLHLPQPENLENPEAIEVVYADTTADLIVEEKVSKVEKEEDGEQMVEVVEEEGVVKAKGLDHMTVFVVTTVSPFTSSFEVTNLNDSGDGSFRQAVINANNNNGGTVTFNIDSCFSEVCTINLDSTVELSGSVYINGFSQDSSSPNTNPFGTQLNSQITVQLHFNSGLLRLIGTNNVVRGVSLTSNGTPKIVDARGSVNNWIHGSYIGVNPNGTCPANQHEFGVEAYHSSDLLIGSDLDGINDEQEINVIGCATERGVFTYLSYGTTWIQHNYIGVGPSFQNLGNKIGFYYSRGSGDILVHKNLIGNNGHGVYQWCHSSATCSGEMTFSENLVGTDLSFYENFRNTSSGFVAAGNSTKATNIIDNHFYHNNRGVQAEDGDSFIVQNNHFQSNDNGLVLSAYFDRHSKNNMVEGNSFLSNTNGLFITTGGTARVTDTTVNNNRFESNSYGLRVSTDRIETISLSNNHFENNSQYGVWNRDLGNNEQLIEATNNWWGSQSGPGDTWSGDGSDPDINAGTGDNVRGAVKYGEWLGQAVQELAFGFETVTQKVDVDNPVGYCNVYTNDTSIGGAAVQILRFEALSYADRYEITGYMWNGSSWSAQSPYNPEEYANNNAHASFEIVDGIAIYTTKATPEGAYAYQVKAYAGAEVVGETNVITSDDYDNTCKFIVDRTEPEAPTWINSPFLTRLGDVNRSGNNQGLNFKFTPSSSTDVERYQYQYVRYNLDGVRTASGTKVTIPTSSCSPTECEWNNVTIEKDQIWVYRLRAVDFTGNASEWTDWNNLSDSEFMNLQAKSPLYSDFIGGTGAFSSDAGYMGSETGFGIREEKLPTSSITNLEKEVLTKETSLEISNEATDQDSEIGKVHLYHSTDGLTYDVIDSHTQNSGTFIVDNLTEGEHCFYTQAEDIANTQSLDLGVGNLEDISEKECDLKVTVDTIAPVITLLSPEDNYYTNQTTVRQEWEASEDTIFEYQYQSCENKPQGQDDCDLIYSTTRTVPWRNVNNNDIAFWWQVRGVDLAGNVGDWSEARKITIDTIAPIVDITSHEEGDFLSGEETILGEILEDNMSHYNLSLYKAEGEQCDIESTWNFSKRIWQRGVYGSNSVEHVLDTQDISNIYGDGLYMIRLAARDLAGNRDPMVNSGTGDSVEVICVTIDNEAPIVSVITITKDGQPAEFIKAGDQIVVKAKVVDELSGVQLVSADFSFDKGYTSRPSPTSVKMFDQGNDFYEVTYTVPENWDQDQIFITVAAKDYEGNRSANRNLALEIVVDNTMPFSEINFPENTKSGDTVYLTQWDGTILGTAEDESSGLEKVELEIQRDSDSFYWNGADKIWQADSYLNLTSSTDEYANWNFSFTPVADEIYYLTSHATDKAGNFEESYNITVVFDKTIPEVNLTIDPANPDGSGSWYITRPTLTMKAHDPSNSGLDNLQYQWNSQSESGWKTIYADGINSAIASTQPPKEGHSVLYYRATDIAGNTFSDVGVKNIYWDATDLTEGPLDVKADPNPTSGSTSTISWTKAEDNIGIAKYKVNWDLRDGDDDHSKEVSGNTTELKISDLQEGTYKVTVTAYDNAGHKKSASTDLVVNRTAPAAPTLTLVDTDTGTATLSWNEIDDAVDYIIMYGTESGNYIYAARVGNITQYTVEGLTAGSYFFVVRAVDNVDNQSANSNEVNTGAILGAVGAATGPAAGFAEAGDVLGDETEELLEEEMELAKLEAESGQILGDADASCTVIKNILPWIILGLQLIVLLTAELIMKRDSSAVKMIIAFGTTFIAIVIYYLLRNSNCYENGSLTMILDRFFWLASGLLSIIIRLIGYGFIEVIDKD